MKTRRFPTLMLGLIATFLVSTLAPGCDEPPPPPMDAKALEEVQKKQMEMIQKEYGPKAVKKAAN